MYNGAYVPKSKKFVGCFCVLFFVCIIIMIVSLNTVVPGRHFPGICFALVRMTTTTWRNVLESFPQNSCGSGNARLSYK
jgi:hypothetical protein